MRKLILGFVFMLLFSMTVHAETISQPDNVEEASGTDNFSYTKPTEVVFGGKKVK